MSVKKKKKAEGATEETFSLGELPPHISKQLIILYKDALSQQALVRSVLDIPKNKDFIVRIKFLVSKKKEKAEFGTMLNQLIEMVDSYHSIALQLEELKKRNGEFIVIRRLMDLIIQQVNPATCNLNQVEALFKLTLLFSLIDNPHIKTVKACFHLFRVFVKKRISAYGVLQKQYSNLVAKGNLADVEICKKLKKWLKEEEQLLKIYKELGGALRLAGAGSLLEEELSDHEFRILVVNKHIADVHVEKEVRQARKKFFFIIGNMVVIPPLNEHIQEFSMKIMGSRKQLSALQDLALLSCLIRSYTMEIARLQQYIHVSPKTAQKKILSLLNAANPFVFSGYKKIRNIPKDFFEFILLENIGHYLTYYVLLVGGIFKSAQFRSPQIQELINGTLEKLGSEGANQKIHSMLNKQVQTTMENF